MEDSSDDLAQENSASKDESQPRFSMPYPSRNNRLRPNTTTLCLVVAAYMVAFLGPFVVLDIPRERALLADVPWEVKGADISSSSLRRPKPPQIHEKVYPSTPGDDNTLISLIAMGLPSNMFLTERCVRSIRARGSFTGHIMIFTDDGGMKQYQRTLIDGQNDHKVLLVQGKVEDRHPKYPNGGRVQYTKHTMKYKRYKTLSNKYLEAVFPTLSPNIQYLMYLDIDNVVTNPLSSFFQDYQEKVNQEHANAGVRDISSHSLVSLWYDAAAPSHNAGKPMLLQGGQFMLERRHGQGCLDAWRNEMDTVPSDLDQPLLKRVAEQYDKYHCVVSLLPDEPKGKHFDLLQENILGLSSQPEQFPTIVHISGHRAKSFSEQAQRNFLQKALDLPNETLASGNGVVSWQDIIQPIGVKGQQPKRQ